LSGYRAFWIQEKTEAYQEYGSKPIETPIESLSLAFTEKTEPYSLYKTGIFFRKPISEKLPIMPKIPGGYNKCIVSITKKLKLSMDFILVYTKNGFQFCYSLPFLWRVTKPSCSFGTRKRIIISSTELTV